MTDTELLDELEANGCWTGDCPHDSQADCNLAIFREAKRVLAERAARRLPAVTTSAEPASADIGAPTHRTRTTERL